MKRLLIGLLVAGAALATSAFTNATSKAKLPGTYYTLNDQGKYERTSVLPNSLNCEQTGVTSCWIEYEEDQGQGFFKDELPAALIISHSEQNGIYNPQ